MITVPDQVIESITGRQKWTAQRDALVTMRVPFLVRPDGKPVVHRLALEQAMGVKLENDEQPVVLNL